MILPSKLTLSNHRVTCIFFENFTDITCEFFKCSTGSNCRQLELMGMQSGTGFTVTIQFDVTQFQMNDTVEFIVRGSNVIKSVDIQGVLTSGILILIVTVGTILLLTLLLIIGIDIKSEEMVTGTGL